MQIRCNWRPQSWSRAGSGGHRTLLLEADGVWWERVHWNLMVKADDCTSLWAGLGFKSWSMLLRYKIYFVTNLSSSIDLTQWSRLTIVPAFGPVSGSSPDQVILGSKIFTHVTKMQNLFGDFTMFNWLRGEMFDIACRGLTGRGW